MITLRDYQTDCIARTRGAMRQHRSIMLQAPTGAGKTAMAAYMAGSATGKKKTTYFICHRKELIDQTSGTFNKVEIPHSFIAAGMDYDSLAPVQVCSIDTLKNRLADIPHPDLCIWDEAHHLGAAGWTKVQEAFDCFHVGLSATPQRLDGKGLDDRFQYLVPGPSVEWLIGQGYLANYRLFSVPGVDLSGVHTKMGDFVKSESEQAMGKPSVTGDIVKHWKQLAADRLTIGFAVSVKHSEYLCEQFKANGIAAEHLDGKTPKKERRYTLERFADGEIKVVFNVGLFAEGFDIAANSGKDVTVGAVIDAAPTQSLGMWLQRCGRSLRPQEQPAVILDHAGNAIRHGLPDQEREWTLKGRVKQPGNKHGVGADVQMNQCSRCYCCHAPAPTCPDCGYVYQIKGRTIEERAGNLVELEKKKAEIQFKRDKSEAKTLDDLVELGIKKGYKNPEFWASKIWTSRQAKRRGRNAY